MKLKPWDLDLLEADLDATRPERETDEEREERYARVLRRYEDPTPIEVHVMKVKEAKAIEGKKVRGANMVLRALGEGFASGGLQLDVFGDEGWKILPISIAFEDVTYRVRLGDAMAEDLERWALVEYQRATEDYGTRLNTVDATRSVASAMPAGTTLAAFVAMAIHEAA